MKLSLMLAAAAALSSLAAGDDWNYLPPQSWQANYPQCQLEPNPIQSPTDIQTPDELVQTATSNAGEGDKEFNNGHTIEVHTDLDEVHVGGTSYKLSQFHFHSPSENKLDGKQFDAEMHMVHTTKDADGNTKVVVVGIFLDSGTGTLGDLPQGANPLRPPTGVQSWNWMPQGSDLAKFEGGLFNSKTPLDGDAEDKVDVDLGKYRGMSPLESLTDQHFIQFQGSFTTPPCTGSVTWLQAKQVLYLSLDDLFYLRSALVGGMRNKQGTPSLSVTSRNGNARDIQPQAGRAFDIVPFSLHGSHGEYEVDAGAEHPELDQVIPETMVQIPETMA